MLTKNQRWKIAWLSETTGLSNEAIARTVGCSKETVRTTKALITELGLTSTKIEMTPTDELNAEMFPNYPYRNTNKVLPDFVELDKKMADDDTYTIFKGWTIYKKQNEGKNVLELSQYYARYRKHRKASGLSYRKDEKPGENMYIDYAGKTGRVFTKKLGNGEVANIFVSNIGKSQRIFMYATPGQTTRDWLEATEETYIYHGGVPNVTIPDNPKAIVVNAVKPKVLQVNIEEFGKHYNVAFIPTRTYKPKDKGVTEGTNPFIYSRVLSDLREMKFFSFKELNAHLREKSDELNNMKFQKFSVSRNDLFYKWDQPALGPLAKTRYPFIETYQRLSTRNEYDVLVDEHFYGVPHQYRNKMVDVHLTKDEVLIYYDMILIAKHKRSFVTKGITRKSEHLHPSHDWFEDKPLAFFWGWAEQFGSAAQQVMAIQFESKRERSYEANRACRDIQEYYLKFGLSSEAFEQVCQFAISYHQTSPSYIHNIMKSKIYLDEEVLGLHPQINHENLRGSNYYSLDNGDQGNVH
ncbi:DDE-type integrase/transposase/recombinase [Pseudoalteromonas sp. JSTW]|uniref:Mu transposase domain-containing protein n=1 Tax=Pseudoalteromonas sp. JSTW TaxID=2752475 RepID=UPI0015D55AE5|nr:DDE-type integrase/transposase/recombinase [Pseudoalteromonas sp. JSTW]QLJ07239.1 transposase [Pseudoalteromonas sp. JSTW]